MKMVENFPKWIENPVEEGEIVRYEEFFLFPRCFRKTCTADMLKTPRLFGKGLNYGHIKTRACLGKV